VSGARGIYRRLRVVEHGCCGRGANLVSVQFVKRSAGDNERQRRTRAKRIREADSRYLRSSIFLLVNLRASRKLWHEDWKRLESDFKYLHVTQATAQRTSAKHATGARYIKSDTAVY